VTGRTGAPVWCVPGLGLDERAWRPTLDALGRGRPSTGHRVVALPAYGVRPQRGQDLAPRALAVRVAALLADLPGPVVLAGHSASSQVVAATAALAPDRVSAVVVVGPTTDPTAATWPRLATRWVRTARRETPRQVPVLVDTYRRTGLAWMARAMDAARREDVREDLHRVRCPVLVVRGPHDRICPEDWATEVAAAGPAASVAVTLSAGGHMVPLTHGEGVAGAVRRFLDG
jgi:pimeloyl-ACP methyl ester carboxylesterase